MALAGLSFEACYAAKFDNGAELALLLVLEGLGGTARGGRAVRGQPLVQAIENRDKRLALQCIILDSQEGQQNTPNAQGNSLLHLLLQNWSRCMSADLGLGWLKDGTKYAENKERAAICVAAIELLLGTYHANPNIRDAQGYMPLYYCLLKCPDLQLSQTLLKAGANPIFKVHLKSLPCSLLEESLLAGSSCDIDTTEAVVARGLLAYPLPSPRAGRLETKNLLDRIEALAYIDTPSSCLQRLLSLFSLRQARDLAQLGPLQAQVYEDIQERLIALSRATRKASQSRSEEEAAPGPRWFHGLWQRFCTSKPSGGAEGGPQAYTASAEVPRLYVMPAETPTTASSAGPIRRPSVVSYHRGAGVAPVERNQRRNSQDLSGRRNFEIK